MNRVITFTILLAGQSACVIGADGTEDDGADRVSASATPAFYCTPGFSYDSINRLCTSATEAVAPFPAAMVAACKQLVVSRPDGSSACETTLTGGLNTRWARSVAIRARSQTVGTSGCIQGTAIDAAAGYCSDGTSVYGPFSADDVAYCKSKLGGATCDTNRVAKGFVRPKPSGDWAYPLALDYGVRDDGVGDGAFAATRANSAGTHSGIDFLAPVGTSVFAVCDSGDVQTGYDTGYGNWIQLACPVPASLAGGGSEWASILYAHLSSVAVVDGGQVARDTRIGATGKTGNAAGVGINAHLHWEVTIQPTRQAAHDDLHGAADNSDTSAADAFVTSLRTACLSPLGVATRGGPVVLGRRPDPYLLLACSVRGKPALSSPPASVQSFLDRWSAHYSASGFNIDAGR